MVWKNKQTITTFGRLEIMADSYSVNLEDSGFVLFDCFKLTGVSRKTSHVCLRPVLEANKKAGLFGSRIQCDFGFSFYCINHAFLKEYLES